MCADDANSNHLIHVIPRTFAALLFFTFIVTNVNSASLHFVDQRGVSFWQRRRGGDGF